MTQPTNKFEQLLELLINEGLIKEISGILPFDIGLDAEEKTIRTKSIDIVDDLSIKLYHITKLDPARDYPCFTSVEEFDLPTGYSLRFIDKESSINMELRDNYDNHVEDFKINSL